MSLSQCCFWHAGLELSVAEDCLAELMGWKVMSWGGVPVSVILAPLNQMELSILTSHHSPLFHKTGKPHLFSAEQTVGAGRCLSWDSQHWLPVASYTVCLPALAGRASAVRWSLKGFYPLIYLSEALGNWLIRMYPSLQGWEEAESEEDAANSCLKAAYVDSFKSHVYL